MHSNNIAMLESARSPGLVDETLNDIRILSKLRKQHFQRPPVADVGVFSKIYRAHTALAELLDHSEWPDLLTSDVHRHVTILDHGVVAWNRVLSRSLRVPPAMSGAHVLMRILLAQR